MQESGRFKPSRPASLSFSQSARLLGSHLLDDMHVKADDSRHAVGSFIAKFSESDSFRDISPSVWQGHLLILFVIPVHVASIQDVALIVEEMQGLSACIIKCALDMQSFPD